MEEGSGDNDVNMDEGDNGEQRRGRSPTKRQRDPDAGIDNGDDDDYGHDPKRQQSR